MFGQQMNTAVPPGPPVPPGTTPGPATGPPPQGAVPGAQVDQMAQMIAMQQIEQAKQQFQTAASGIIALGEQFPMIAGESQQLAAAIMQLATKAISSLQATPVTPPM